ncbi:hypothetical protein GLOTRDRAFT_135328 [Gloeophyllum trabeum ATCC 11539]|uniref:Uncharacterized protein n=1 Tax=Gloeophyllum trabeum (strain ATCC 11539 / FP-39264 / Madison 617) TaxID=670483 RepID=S7S020_GLOTA|nr:uncharacterized protein GLOTRDRAFT_135328 [Gloeophyllum trabeum ATCC 11539]EPQ60685.1 hypothetical protein GLOTRDRAFT_135328 [Gloeophyllum trabeum ATCC 11539]
MASRPTREALESMSRQDLQKLCKNLGLKANLKSDALIDLILRDSEPPADPGGPRSRSTSVAVARQRGSRSREHSTASMIVHSEAEDDPVSPAEDTASTPEPRTGPVRPSRTRKAKETQLRLGVGRPIAAGGSGARAVTRASNASKSRRGKTRSYQTTEMPIPEEPEPQASEAPPLPVEPSPPDPGPSTANQRNDAQTVAAVLPPAAPVASSSAVPYEGIDAYVANLIKPLEQRVQSQASELERLTVQVAGTEELMRKVESMTAELEALRLKVDSTDKRVTSIQEHMNSADAAYSHLPSTPRFSTPNLTPGIPRVISPAASEEDDSENAPTALGKRHRGATCSDTHGMLQDNRGSPPDEDLAGSSLPENKRVRVSGPEPSADPSSVPADEGHQTAATSSHPAGKSETQIGALSQPFQMQDAEGSQPGPSQRLTTTSAGASENQPQQPEGYDFSFNSAAFDPITSTPYVARFPHPELPQSPTPVLPPSGSSYGPVDRSARRERNALYHPLGTPGRPRTRPIGDSSLGSGAFINPAALMRPPSTGGRKISSNDIGASLGMTGPPVPDTPAPPVRRTMYGTELDGDTRFGDFGVEGVATGFWNPAKYNPTLDDYD